MGRAKASSSCSIKMRPCCGALPCPDAAGGAAANATVLPTRPLSQGQINAQERLKRQTWQRYRSWSRITSGVLLHVMGVVQYGTSRIFYKIVPQFDANEFRPYIHQVMRTLGPTDQKVVRVVDRSGINRATNWPLLLSLTRISLSYISYRPTAVIISIRLKVSGDA